MSKEEKPIEIQINEIEEMKEEKQRNADEHAGKRTTGRILVLFFIGLLCACYYIFVVELCILTVEVLEAKVTFLVIFHLLYLLCLWSYLRTVMTPPAVPPAKFRLSEADKQLYLSDERLEVLQEILDRMAKDLPIYTREISYCEKCQALKPDRCHHCPICDICVLKLDHHCVFLNNCVGFSNYKFFLQCIMYALLLCLFSCAVSLYCSILFWTHRVPDTNSKIPIIGMFVVTALFSLFLFLFAIAHFNLAIENVTDREYSDDIEINPYDLGCSKNLRQVFGNEKRYWFLPIFSGLGDGYSFPMGDAAEDIEKNAERYRTTVSQSKTIWTHCNPDLRDLC